ncbi:MAG: hypothetical protein LUG99_10370 [Lachnospiraceae bacterium]|nr:hypothetical protein [Lachnospiraceae bacterium]
MVKVERTFPAPASLAEEEKKANGSYREPDVIERLYRDFHNKCYICEIGNLQDPQVEHLLPHQNGRYPERKFDWNNLFLSCGHCNSVKNQRKYDVGIIDCCKEDPEEQIWFRLHEKETQVSAKDGENAQAVLTAQLVTEVFNQRNTGLRTRASAQRLHELTLEMDKFYAALEEVTEYPESAFALRKMQVLLRRESAFAAFKRNYIREHQERYSKLFAYIA